MSGMKSCEARASATTVFTIQTILKVYHIFIVPQILPSLIEERYKALAGTLVLVVVKYFTY